MKKPILSVLNGEVSAYTPLWMMRQAGRYLPEYQKVRQTVSGFLELCYTPELAAEVTLQPIERFGFDAAILFADILVIPDAMGMNVNFVQGEGPKLDAITSLSDIEALHGGVEEHVSPIYETVRLVKKELPERTALIGFAGSPWTVSAYMIEGGSSKDFKKFLQFVRKNPEAFHALMQRLTDATIVYLKGQIEAGVEIIQLFESWASLATDRECEAYIYPYTGQIVDALHEAYPKISIIGFPRKIGGNLGAYIKNTAIDAVGLDEGVSLDQGNNLSLPIQGNLSNVLLAEDIKGFLSQLKQTRKAWEGKPWICNLGHGILPHTPLDHVYKFVDEVRNGT